MTLYITSASFEDRCLALVSSLATKGDAERRVLMFDFRGYENVDPYLWNRARLLREMQLGGTAYDRVPVSLGAPLEGKEGCGTRWRLSHRSASYWTFQLCRGHTCSLGVECWQIWGWTQPFDTTDQGRTAGS